MLDSSGSREAVFYSAASHGRIKENINPLRSRRLCGEYVTEFMNCHTKVQNLEILLSKIFVKSKKLKVFICCGYGTLCPMCEICFHILFFISRPPAPNHVRGSWASLESAENSEKSNLFLQSGVSQIGGKILSATGAKGFQTQEVCRRHESFSPIGISPIGEKFHSLRSPRSLRETPFYLVAAMLRCFLLYSRIRLIIFKQL